MKKILTILLAAVCFSCFFLAACNNRPCETHSFGEWETFIAATCDDVGVEVRYCTKCNHEDQKIVLSIGHSYGTWNGEIFEPNYDADCFLERTCSVCGDIEKRIEGSYFYTSGLEFFQQDDRTYIVVGYSGSDLKVKIPPIFNERSVVGILEGAFSGIESITEVKLPGSIGYIGENAFSGCKSLEKITIPSSVFSIGANAFAGCDLLTITCEFAQRPTQWSSDWNSSGCTEIWKRP